MAVRIRLRRTGKKKQPQYRVVVAESSSPRDGRFLEVIGHYNPRIDPPAVSVDEERALFWLGKGAKPSDTVRHILVRKGTWEKFTGEAVVPQTAPEQATEGSPAASPEPEEASN